MEQPHSDLELDQRLHSDLEVNEDLHSSLEVNGHLTAPQYRSLADPGLHATADYRSSRISRLNHEDNAGLEVAELINFSPVSLPSPLSAPSILQDVPQNQGRLSDKVTTKITIDSPTSEEETISGRRPYWRRGSIWILLVTIPLVVVGAVVGGIMGSKHTTNNSSSSATGVPTSSLDTGAPSTTPSLVATSSTSSIPNPTSSDFISVYTEPDNGVGIGTYDLADIADRSFAFDYDHSGLLDHMVFYRPGHGAVYILRNENGTFVPIYHESAGGSGIGGCDMLWDYDSMFAFDYEHSGRLDYLFVYRPGPGDCWILKNENGVFTPVYNQLGIGGWKMNNTMDRAFAFDNDQSGLLDHVVIYRPGSGAISIIANDEGQFSAVYAQPDGGSGIGSYNISDEADQGLAFDFDHSGKMDHLLLYRPGTGLASILKHDGDSYRSVYDSGDPLTGIGGYDLMASADRVITYDYDSSGRQDYLVLYRPNSDLIQIMKHYDNGTFARVYGDEKPGEGIAGFHLLSEQDQAYAYDYHHSGDLDHIVLYRPGLGAVVIAERK